MRRSAALLLAVASATACSSADTEPATAAPLAANSMAIAVNGGPSASPYPNGLFASATVCLPGDAARCQTIDGLLVDTGSTGLRLLASVLTLPLPAETDAAGSDLGNCIQFTDASYLWGRMVRADVKLADQTAASIPIQVAYDPGSPGFAAAPSGCTTGGGANAGTVEALGARGVLGLAVFQQDCGQACATDVSPGVYYRCSNAGCTPATAALEDQATNPVWKFARHNNGYSVSLPAIGATGSPAVSGALTFGIGDQPNNALGGATVLALDTYGAITTVFEGRSYGSSSLDTGTNGIFFLNAAASNLPACRTATGFYCPPTTVALSATLLGANGASVPAPFAVANAEALFASNALAFDDLGGTNDPAVGFLWGLSFFYGRTVFNAIEGQATPGGVGPFWAY